MKNTVLLQTDFKDLELFRRGKVRDVYDLGDELLVVSTDRISCFDVVLPNGIPHKGEVLTSISLFWFSLLTDVTEHHLITADVKRYPKEIQKYASQLQGRSMLVKKTKALPVECIVRGYLAGSGWKEYAQTGAVCGIDLPEGLLESSQLPQIIFTPSTKAEEGHDQNVHQGYVDKLIGAQMSKKIADLSIAIYKKAADYALSRGIIIADTKFEFGLLGDRVILIDEVLTPDSSRFWPRDLYKPGQGQPSFDKQFVRDYLESLDWDKKPPAPGLPDDIIERTSRKYLDAYRLLTGKELVRG
ncbi:MAG TPA: phosphoribosylaminoimidazolesuccinocarboxamide synthase [Candidatus Omnitrophota bacterium]|nr:phosphoribosylaminoimidazolesuccinocarboxamide synthase [Candidatus Omnitrophota bacterium]HPT07716.1 phosphoribosylaminoimidazolesuccinocarboxamide synthase [Candidatus Omnitrophota bacterium]